MTLSHAYSAPSAASTSFDRAWDDSADMTAPSPRPLDLVHLTRQTFGEKRLESELLRMFMRQARQIMAALAPGAADAAGPPRPSTADLLHTLLGSARVVGAFEVARLAEDFERRHRGSTSEPSEGLSEAERAALAPAVDSVCSFIACLVGAA